MASNLTIAFQNLNILKSIKSLIKIRRTKNVTKIKKQKFIR